MKPAPSSGHVTELSKAQKFTFFSLRGRPDSIAFAPNLIRAGRNQHGGARWPMDSAVLGL